jgi:5-formyltetrahydrofolate cyclo-ligase
MKLSNQVQKSNLRKEILHKRNALNQFEISAKSKLIQKNVIRTHEFIESKTIGLYLPTGSEVETWDIINHALNSGRKLLLPRIVINNIRYYTVEQKDFDNDSFDMNRFGIKEPKITNGNVDFIDLLIVPGIAFDSYGYRIGYGFGYYDKYLTNKKYTKCFGLAYDLQYIKNRIPTFAYDRKIDALVTESGTRIFNTP